MQNLLNTSEASEYIGCSPATLISYANAGKIQASYTMRRWKFRLDDLDLFIESQRRSR
jgi:predicted site-specific integrase-resolvase